MSEKKPKSITSMPAFARLSTDKRRLYISAAAIATLLAGSVYAEGMSRIVSEHGIHSAISETTNNKEDTDLMKATKHGADISVKWSAGSVYDSNRADTKVSVDGKSVKIPRDGKSHQIIGSKDGKTKIEVTSNSISTGGSASSSVTELRVDSYTDKDIDNETRISRDNMD